MSRHKPFVRVLNNTIFGNDGRQSFNADSATVESNDTIYQAVETQQGIAANPQSYTARGVIGDNSALPVAGQDVDFYSFYLGVGERVQIDIDNTTIDTALRMFDSNGRPVDLNNGVGSPLYLVNGAAAPGETVGNDHTSTTQPSNWCLLCSRQWSDKHQL